MIAERTDVILKHLEHLHLHHPVQKAEIIRSLHQVSCISQKHMSFGRPYAVYERLHAKDSSPAVVIGLDLTMEVIGEKHHEFVVPAIIITISILIIVRAELFSIKLNIKIFLTRTRPESKTQDRGKDKQIFKEFHNPQKNTISK